MEEANHRKASHYYRLHLKWLGLRDYEEALQEQLTASEIVRRGERSTDPDEMSGHIRRRTSQNVNSSRIGGGNNIGDSAGSGRSVDNVGLANSNNVVGDRGIGDDIDLGDTSSGGDTSINANAGIGEGSGILIACEHPTVVTLGRRSQSLDDILVSMEILRQKSVKIVATERGGHATLHNPGQLVLYPILPLRRWGLGVRDYVEALERATALFFAEWGIEVTRAYEPGLWVNDKKIASFGIRVDRGVSMHGAALNLSNDLEAFQWIKQCGQAVQATNLTSELATFMDEIPSFNLEVQARRWLELFLQEIPAAQERRPLNFFQPEGLL